VGEFDVQGIGVEDRLAIEEAADGVEFLNRARTADGTLGWWTLGGTDVRGSGRRATVPARRESETGHDNECG
jgi:hypothetical protein